MGWGPQRAAFGFAFLGLVSAVVQGGLIRRLVPRFGEPRLIVAGVATLAVGFAGLAVRRGASRRCWAATLVVGVGQGLVSPTVSGLLSRVTPAERAGGGLRHALLGADPGADDQLPASPTSCSAGSARRPRSGRRGGRRARRAGLALVVARRVAAEAPEAVAEAVAGPG